MRGRTKDDWLKLEDAIAGPSVFKPAAIVAASAMTSLLVTAALTGGSLLSLLPYVVVFVGGLVFVIRRMKKLKGVARPIFEQNLSMSAKEAVAESRRRLREGRA